MITRQQTCGERAAQIVERLRESDFSRTGNALEGLVSLINNMSSNSAGERMVVASNYEEFVACRFEEHAEHDAGVGSDLEMLVADIKAEFTKRWGAAFPHSENEEMNAFIRREGGPISFLEGLVRGFTEPPSA